MIFCSSIKRQIAAIGERDGDGGGRNAISVIDLEEAVKVISSLAVNKSIDEPIMCGIHELFMFYGLCQSRGACLLFSPNLL